MTFKLTGIILSVCSSIFPCYVFQIMKEFFIKRPTDSSLLATKNGITDLFQGLFVPSSRFGAETAW